MNEFNLVLSKPERLEKNIRVFFSETQYKKLCAIATAYDMSLSALCRTVLVQYFTQVLNTGKTID